MLHRLCGVKLIIRLSQPNLAEVGVGAELGNITVSIHYHSGLVLDPLQAGSPGVASEDKPGG